MVTVSSKVKALLIGEGLVSENDWSRACSGDGEPIETLLEEGGLNENALMEVMGRDAGIAPVDLRRVEFDAAVEWIGVQRGILAVVVARVAGARSANHIGSAPPDSAPLPARQQAAA